MILMTSLSLYTVVIPQSPWYNMAGRLSAVLVNKRISNSTKNTGNDRKNPIKASWNSSKYAIPKRSRSPEENRIQSSRDEPAPKVQKISSNLLREIESLLRTEHHHIISKKDRNNSLVPHVEWCYYYLDPKIPGHITGGRAHLHHFCRVCKRTCLHLLGKYGTGKRQCLVCAADEMGWGEDEVPSWYFHDTCEHCKNDFKRQSGGGGYGRGSDRRKRPERNDHNSDIKN